MADNLHQILRVNAANPFLQQGKRGDRAAGAHGRGLVGSGACSGCKPISSSQGSPPYWGYRRINHLTPPLHKAAMFLQTQCQAQRHHCSGGHIVA